MIECRVEQDALKSVEEKLGNLSEKAPAVVKKAVNETARQAKKKLAQKAKNTYTVKNVGFNSEMKIDGARIGGLEATISAKGEPLPLDRFKMSSGKKSVKVKVLKSGGLKELVKKSKNIKAFVNNIAPSGQVRKRNTAKGKSGSRVGHVTIGQREGKERLAINAKFGSSTAAMLGSERTYGEIQPDIAEDLKKNLEKHIALLMEG